MTAGKYARVFLFACVLVGALLGSAPPARAEGPADSLSICYAHAGLTEVTLQGGKLRYVWHTPRS